MLSSYFSRCWFILPSRASLWFIYLSIPHVWHSMPVQRNHLEREHRKRACPQ
jgi:hypothetical protein